MRDNNAINELKSLRQRGFVISKTTLQRAKMNLRSLTELQPLANAPRLA